jgi:uncharacterized membrane protein YhaH (DUF805 family)
LADRSKLTWLFFGLSGRISPAACLLGGLFVFVLQMFLFYKLMRVDPETSAAHFWEAILSVMVLLSVWVNFALTAKRFHDFGKPTAFAAFSLLFGLVLYIVLYFIKGDPGPNRYGAITDAPS